MALVMLVLANLGVMVSIYLILWIVGYMGGNNIFDVHNANEIQKIFLISMTIGFGGSFISLLLSKYLAKKSLNIHILDKNEKIKYKALYTKVEYLARKAGVNMPEVGVYYGPPNAFATGWDKNSALIAVSTSLIENLDDEELRGVLAHEISHIKNGDMVTMTLLQGVMNTFVIFISTIVVTALFSSKKDDEDYIYEEEDDAGKYFIMFLIQLVLTTITTIIIMAYSRHREYKADEGAIELEGYKGIYHALYKLSKIDTNTAALPGSLKSFGIIGFFGLFDSHPHIGKRLKHILEVAKIK